jgi:hypothetical protein
MRVYTSDIDWAPEEVIHDMLSIFERFNTRCTLFVTHNSEVIRKCNRDLFEVAIHPNFNDILFNKALFSAEEKIKELLDFYPEAKGVRSHSMTQSSALLNLFRKSGLIYESNQFIPYSKHLEPQILWNGLKRVPYNWEDDMHYLHSKTFDSDGFDDYSGLRIYDFHPVHVFLNSENEARYMRAKEFYKNTDELKKFKNEERKGTRNLLFTILEEDKGTSGQFMIEIANTLCKQI